MNIPNLVYWVSILSYNIFPHWCQKDFFNRIKQQKTKMLGARASRMYRTAQLFFRESKNYGIVSNSISRIETSKFRGNCNSGQNIRLQCLCIRSGFHGSSILHSRIPSNIIRTTTATHVNGFLSDSSTSFQSEPVTFSNGNQLGSVVNGRSWFSTSSINDGAAPKQAAKQRKAITSVANGPLEQQVADMKILRTLASHLLMRDNQVAVDWLTTATGNAGDLASFMASNPTMLAIFATPAAVLIGYGIACSGASAFNVEKQVH